MLYIFGIYSRAFLVSKLSIKIVGLLKTLWNHGLGKWYNILIITSSFKGWYYEIFNSFSRMWFRRWLSH